MGVNVVTAMTVGMRPDAVDEFLEMVRYARAGDAVLVDAAEVARFVRPMEWMLQAVAGGGVKLTAAGYLPPAVVSRAMTELGWAEDWIGAGNREDLTVPVLALRESMHQFKLLHRRKGVLLPTPKGRTLTEDPAALWEFLARRLLEQPREVECRAWEFFLLAAATRNFRTRNEYLWQVATGLESIGWVGGDGHRVTPDQAFGLIAGPWRFFRSLGAFERSPGFDRWAGISATGAAFARYSLGLPSTRVHLRAI